MYEFTNCISYTLTLHDSCTVDIHIHSTSVLPNHLTKRGKMDDREEVDSYTQFSTLVDFVFDRIKHVFNEGISVLDVDGFTLVNKKVVLVGNLEDGQGLSRVVGCKANTAEIGACPLDNAKSYRFMSSQYFLGFVNNLPRDHPEKLKWKEEFKGDPVFAAIADKPPDEKCTTAKAKEIQREYARNGNDRNKKTCSFPYENVFARHINRYKCLSHTPTVDVSYIFDE